MIGYVLVYTKSVLAVPYININFLITCLLLASNFLNNCALSNIKQVTFSTMGFEKAGESYFSPDGKSIIFQAVPFGKKHYQIYVLNLENNAVKLVSTGVGACTCAYFKPNGQKIIFASSHADPNCADDSKTTSIGYQSNSSQYAWQFTPYMNIYEANLDGTSLVPLTNGPAYSAECAYSADGSKIVFASNRSGSMNLYIMDSDGSNVQQITFDYDVYNGGSFFSPDQSKIIYRADHAKKHYLQIYLMDLFTKQIRQLTDNNVVNWAPFWHPSGQLIVFTTSLHGHDRYELYLLNIETGNSYRLTNHVGFDGLASFDATGTKITWTSKRSLDNSCQVFIADFVMPEELSCKIYKGSL